MRPESDGDWIHLGYTHGGKAYDAEGREIELGRPEIGEGAEIGEIKVYYKPPPEADG